jgi:hypothetical protein
MEDYIGRVKIWADQHKETLNEQYPKVGYTYLRNLKTIAYPGSNLEFKSTAIKEIRLLYTTISVTH